MKLRGLGSLLKRTYEEWNKHDASTWGASLSYYTVLSLAPLLVIAVSIAGIFFGAKAAQGQIASELGSLVGSSGAKAIEGMLRNTKSPGAGVVASIVGFLVLLFGASGVFTQLRKALNRIWEVKPKPTSGWWSMLVEEFFSFAMVVGIGFLLLVSLLISAALEGVQKFAAGYLPGGGLQIVNSIVSLLVITALFAMIYRVVPDRRLPWNSLWIGSFATAILFTAGKYLLGVYLGRASVTSAYGAAGSLVALFIWVYYSSQLFLFGAEFTRLYAFECGAVCPLPSPKETAHVAQEQPRHQSESKEPAHTPVPVPARRVPVTTPAANRVGPAKAVTFALAWVAAVAGVNWLRHRSDHQARQLRV